jgi:transaldolase
MTSKLEQLKQYTTLVADTGDVSLIRALQPQDATTNPSLLLNAARQEQYAALLEQARTTHPGNPAQAAVEFAVAVGLQISQLIPGRISTEVDARLSFDEEATYAAALQLIAAYQARGLGKERILIKIAATWEGIRAAERLEKQGIQTNLTLLFSFAQAVACAEAGVYLISPFVGRIYDWYKKTNNQDYSGLDDPGVQSVSRIYRYYKTHGYQTIVMGASFRNLGQIEALTGCDRLTISPALIDELAGQEGMLQRQLSPEQPGEERTSLNEAAFRWQHNEDAMATEKLAEGIRAFAVDQRKLEALFATGI